MPAPLITALEALSAYRHVYPPGDRQAGKNPVAWSHLKMNVAGRAWHVLSRVADFGLDYSQRGNKLAHHVAFEAAEQTAGGPACLLDETGNMETNWDGQPRMLPVGRHLRSAPRQSAVCTAWQALTGDPGWAGVLAESFLENPGRQIYIVFAPGMDLLPLMTEAIALLPAESRWNVTFSTYFTSLPPGATCAWRCVLAGSPEAEQGKKFGKALHIDLCQPVPPAAGGSLVEAARTGRAIPSAPTGPRFADAGPDLTESESDAEWELRPTAEDTVPETGAGMPFPGFSTSAGGVEYGVSRPAGMPPPPPPANSIHKRRTQADARRTRNQLIIGCLVVLGLAVAVLAVPASRNWVLQRGSSRVSSDDAVADDPQSDRAGRNNKSRPTKDHDDGQAPAESDEVTSTPGGREGSVQEIERPDNKSSSDDGAASKSKAAAPDADEKPVANQTPPADRPSKDPQDDKPDAAQKKNDPPPQNLPRFGKHELAIVRDEKDYVLYAISLEDAVKEGRALTIPMRDAKSCTWELFAPVGRSEIRFKPKGDDTKVATIPKEEGVGSNLAEVLSLTRSYDQNGCSFHFEKLADGWESIKWCLLSVSSANSKPRLIALQDPALKPRNRQFEAFTYVLPLARPGADESIPTIFVDSLEIAVSDVEQPLRFENPADDFLSCVLPPEIAGKMLFAESDRRLEIKLSQTSEKVTATMTLVGSGLNKIFDKGVDQHIEKIEKQHVNLPLEPAPSFSSRREKLKNELHTSGPEKKNPTAALNDLEDAVKARIQDARQGLTRVNDDERPALQARLQELGKMLAELNALETARDAFLKFKEGLKNAEVRRLRLHYNFEPKPDRGLPRRVSIRLEYGQ